MKKFFAYLALYLTIAISMFLFIALAFSPAKADEITNRDNKAEVVQDYIQCTYKPSQSDEVIKFCGTLKGKGSGSVRLCGINYVIDVECK